MHKNPKSKPNSEKERSILKHIIFTFSIENKYIEHFEASTRK